MRFKTVIVLVAVLFAVPAFAQKDNMNMNETLNTVRKTKAESAKEKIDPKLKGPLVIEKPIIEKMDFKEKQK